MADWWNRISITFNDLVDPISLHYSPRAYDTRHVPLRASARYVHYGTRATCHVNAERKLLVVLWKNVRYANAKLAKWKEFPLHFSTIVLNSAYPFMRARLFLPSLRVPSSFNETLKRTRGVLFAKSPFSRVLKTFCGSTMAIGMIIIRVVFFGHSKPREVPQHYNLLNQYY